VFRIHKWSQSMIRHRDNSSESWKTLPWKKFRRNLFRLQIRVYKAVQVGDKRKAKSLQKLILKSTAARLKMNLSGAELKKLVNAILSAYPTKEDLAMMIEFELEENLNAITGGGNLTQLIFNLVTKWAIPRGKIYRLIIAAYETNPDNPELTKFYESVVLKRFSIDSSVKKRDFGPDINWQGETDEFQLQSWLKPEPDYWDVGFLKQAIEQSASVCRLEIPSRNISGTGVLITPNKLLTNYHVLQTSEEDNIDRHALNAVLKFGCLTLDNGLESQGKSFQLDRLKPILGFSKTDNLDYILLQIESKITQATDIYPARWDSNKVPFEKMGIKHSYLIRTYNSENELLEQTDEN